MRLNALFIVLCLFFLTGCPNVNSRDSGSGETTVNEVDSPVGQALRGDHLLIREVLIEKGEREYFKFDFNIDYNILYITFAIKRKDYTVVLGKLPMSKVRFIYDNTLEVPQIKFCWRPNKNKMGFDQILANYVIYAVITSPRAFIPEYVKIPMINFTDKR